MVNVKDFGAIADSKSHPLSTKFDTLEMARAVYPFVTSLNQELDWAAITKAIEVVKTQNGALNPERWGGVVFFPFGVYVTKDTISLEPRVRLSGEWRDASVISYSGAGAAVYIDKGVGWEIENLGIRGGSVNLLMDSSEYFSLRNVKLFGSTESAIRHSGLGNVISGEISNTLIECSGSAAGLELLGGKVFSNIAFFDVTFRGAGPDRGGAAIIDRNETALNGRWLLDSVLFQGPFNDNKEVIRCGSWIGVSFNSIHCSDIGNRATPFFLVPEAARARMLSFTNFFTSSARANTFRIEGQTRSFSFESCSLGGAPANPNMGPLVDAFRIEQDAVIEAVFVSCEFFQSPVTNNPLWKRCSFLGANSPK